MERSPHWREGQFHNPQALWTDYPGALLSMLRRDPDSTPRTPVPVLHPTGTSLASASRKGLRATWLGHSTVYLEVDGVRILTDPVWGDRASPFTWVGPKRFYAPLIALEDLPVPQAVVISHDHYDHLDRATIRRMRHWDTQFIVPLGVGAHLEAWGGAAKAHHGAGLVGAHPGRGSGVGLHASSARLGPLVVRPGQDAVGRIRLVDLPDDVFGRLVRVHGWRPG